MKQLLVDQVNPIPSLSQRELEVVRLLARQMSTTQIAAAMSISVNTVRTRVRRALLKLAMDDREGAVHTAVRVGLSNAISNCTAPLAGVS